MKNPFWKYVFLTAATMAVAVLLLTVTLHLVGLNPFGRFDFMFMPIYLIFLVWGMFRYRRSILGGYMEGWRAISFGIVANFIAMIMYCGLLYGFLRNAPEALEKHQIEVDSFNAALKKGAELHKDDEERMSTLFLEVTKNTERITPITMAIDKFIKMGAVGFVIVMMASLLMIKQKRI